MGGAVGRDSTFIDGFAYTITPLGFDFAEARKCEHSSALLILQRPGIMNSPVLFTFSVAISAMLLQDLSAKILLLLCWWRYVQSWPLHSLDLFSYSSSRQRQRLHCWLCFHHHHFPKDFPFPCWLDLGFDFAEARKF